MRCAMCDVRCAGQPQRGCGSKPRVARLAGYPGSTGQEINYPNGVAAAQEGRATTPLGLSLQRACSQGRPGAGQPWALSLNPVGVVSAARESLGFEPQPPLGLSLQRESR